MKAPEAFPVEMKRGNVSVRIYRVSTTKVGREYVEFRVGDYTPEGQRKFKTFAGIRHKELHRLEWKDIDLNSGFITIPKKKASLTFDTGAVGEGKMSKTC